MRIDAFTHPIHIPYPYPHPQPHMRMHSHIHIHIQTHADAFTHAHTHTHPPTHPHTHNADAFNHTPTHPPTHPHPHPHMRMLSPIHTFALRICIWMKCAKSCLASGLLVSTTVSFDAGSSVNREDCVCALYVFLCICVYACVCGVHDCVF